MIETVLINYLSGKIDVPVYMEKPARPPVSFVVIEKTGAAMSNQIETSLFAFQSHASTLFHAASLNETVKRAMLAAPGEVAEIASARLDSDYNFTDTASKQYRYQAVFSITHYEV